MTTKTDLLYTNTALIPLKLRIVLRIRLSRTGKTAQESFRIVVAPHTRAVKGKYLELLGHYRPAEQPKYIDFNKERIEYWISKGAQPSDSVASLLKRNGFANMDKFIAVRTPQKRSKKKGGDEKAAPAAAPAV